MITKHKDHVCKECKERLPSFMELLKHVAEQHAKETSEEKEIKDIGEEIIQNDTAKEEKEVKKDFVFSECMLDEFLS